MSAVRDFVCGYVAGAVGVLMEYPFDTVKVLLQTHGGGNCVSCARHLYQHDGVAGFYRGVSSRLIASGLEHACVFWSYKFGLRICGADVECPDGISICLAGCVSGVASMMCLTPFELVKCTMQAGCSTSTSTWACAMELFRREQLPLQTGWRRWWSGVHGLYRGGTATLLREIPGTIAWCGTYDVLKMRFAKMEDVATTELSLSSRMLAGGCSGVAFWTVLFPADVIKTRMQVDPTWAKMGIVKAACAQWQQYGLRGLYAGWWITCVRSFPSNAAIFATFDLSSMYLHGRW